MEYFNLTCAVTHTPIGNYQKNSDLPANTFEKVTIIGLITKLDEDIFSLRADIVSQVNNANAIDLDKLKNIEPDTIGLYTELLETLDRYKGNCVNLIHKLNVCEEDKFKFYIQSPPVDVFGENAKDAIKLKTRDNEWKIATPPIEAEFDNKYIVNVKQTKYTKKLEDFFNLKIEKILSICLHGQNDHNEEIGDEWKINSDEPINKNFLYLLYRCELAVINEFAAKSIRKMKLQSDYKYYNGFKDITSFCEKHTPENKNKFIYNLEKLMNGANIRLQPSQKIEECTSCLSSEYLKYAKIVNKTRNKTNKRDMKFIHI